MGVNDAWVGDRSVDTVECPDEIQRLTAVLHDLTQSVGETAVVQPRVEIWKDDKKQIHGEHERWSKYANEYIPGGESQSRTLKETKRRLGKSRKTN